MGGLGSALDIARSALNVQRYGLEVTAHNIANVNTPGYSRQSPMLTAKPPEPFGGVILGHGVDLTNVTRAGDRFIEKRLMDQKSGMASSGEMENYMKILEGVFNEDPETGMSAMLSRFWNLWQDVANNPSGTPERVALLQHGVFLSERFNSLDSDLAALERELTGSIGVGIQSVNELTAQIADLNARIARMELQGDANDLRDKRNEVLSNLSEYLDVNAFEQSDGSLTVVAARGCVLVQGNNSYDLELGGDNSDRVRWQASGGSTVDITNYIGKGKLAGWLDMRDEIIAKYKRDLSTVAKEFIWIINRQHSQGVGAHAFSAVTGEYTASDRTVELADQGSGLDFFDKIKDGTFNLWVYAPDGTPIGGAPSVITIDADPGGTTLEGLATAIDAVSNINAAVTADGRFSIQADSGYTFAFSRDDSNVLAALGINTFFSGAGSGGMAMGEEVTSDTRLIAAAQVGSDGRFAPGDNTNALAISGLQYTSMDIARWSCDRVNGNSEERVTATIESYYHAMVGHMGVTSSGISRERAMNEEMVKRLGDIRDSISAVSLDEEMTNLIKYQHAYQAASKLVTVSDEMLDTLLSMK